MTSYADQIVQIHDHLSSTIYKLLGIINPKHQLFGILVDSFVQNSQIGVENANKTLSIRWILDMNTVFEMYYHGEDGERTSSFPHFEGFHFETKVYELKGNYTQPDSDEGVPELNSYLISWYVNCIKPAAKNDGESDTVMLMDTGNMTQVRGQSSVLFLIG